LKVISKLRVPIRDERFFLGEISDHIH